MSLFGVRKNRVQSVSRSVNMRHTKDFDWRPAKHNPYTKKDEVKKERRRVGLLVSICVFCICATIGVLIFHPTFRINDITIEGTKRVAHDDIESVVNGILDGYQFFFIPQNNYFFAALDDVESILLERYPIHAVTLETHFPNQLRIVVEEKQATMIYDNGRQYSYIDEDGVVVDVLKNVHSSEWQRTQATIVPPPAVVSSTTSTTTTDDGTTTLAKVVQNETVTSETHTPDVASIQAEFGSLPLIYAVSGADSTKDAQVLDTEVLEAIRLYYAALEQRQIKPVYVEIDTTGMFGQVKTGEGWGLLVQFDPAMVEQQMTVLDQVRVEKQKESAVPLTYIDVRYSGRAYWK